MKSHSKYIIPTCTILGFWADQNKEFCEKFIAGHDKILLDHGLSYLTSTKNTWVSNSDVYVFLAMSDNKPVGGIRLEKKRENQLLPFERALRPFDQNIEQYIKNLGYLSVFEACGLWNAKSIAGNDLGIFLSRACLAVSTKIQMDCILSLNGVYTYKIPRDMGSSIVRQIGNNGLFKYPIERFHSALWIQDDLVSLHGSSEDCRKRVFSLRKDYNQTYLESNNKNGIKITYNLSL